jgi:outer membrane receptor for ferrienterochelin and colicins
MNKLYISITLFILIIPLFNFAQQQRTDANIVGHIVNTENEHIPFASVIVKGTTIGTSTDATGHYQMVNLPADTLILKAECLGYKPKEKKVIAESGKTKEIKFQLKEDQLNIEEIVVTGNRSGEARTDASVIVNTLEPKLYASTESKTLGEGLNFTPGLRMENNCQNCGFSQVRMNGMEGPYSQILINSRPIFSGLAGVYGLELIPSNMIQRVEVIRGGGSALYGSNAIAGTINLILKEPNKNFYEFSINSSNHGIGLNGSGQPAEDYTANFNTSLVSSDNKTGMALYGFYRNKDPFDANDDSFSELPSIKNTTVGTRLFHRFNSRNKITLDLFHINEARRGGNDYERPPHMADIAEQVSHRITTAAITYDQFFRKQDVLSVYASGQKVSRDSYYGARESLSDYGETEDFSYTTGAQYNAHLGMSRLIIGVENKGAWLEDKKLAYPDIDNASVNQQDSITNIPDVGNRLIADQTTNTIGTFAEYEIDWNKWNVSAGARFDHYAINDHSSDNSDISGNVISPRVTLKYNVKEFLQARLSYSQGYRAPQIYDEDLHIETSGARKVIHKNAPDLKEERSHSYMASIDYNKKIGNSYLGLLIEGFYTELRNAFVNEIGQPDENGTVIYTRTNAEGAVVKGLNTEFNLVPVNNLKIKAGFTLQSSEYKSVHEFNKKTFFRTPDDYGYLTMDWKLTNKFGISSSGTYTGRMLVPYFGNTLSNPEAGELRTSERFYDLDIKLRFNQRINGAKIQFFGGVKNIFNSYQDDFDSGINRDPGYIYGPKSPRTIYFGIKIGNMLDVE